MSCTGATVEMKYNITALFRIGQEFELIITFTQYIFPAEVISASNFKIDKNVYVQ